MVRYWRFYSQSTICRFLAHIMCVVHSIRVLCSSTLCCGINCDILWRYFWTKPCKWQIKRVKNTTISNPINQNSVLFGSSIYLRIHCPVSWFKSEGKLYEYKHFTLVLNQGHFNIIINAKLSLRTVHFAHIAHISFDKWHSVNTRVKWISCKISYTLDITWFWIGAIDI